MSIWSTRVTSGSGVIACFVFSCFSLYFSRNFLQTLIMLPLPIFLTYIFSRASRKQSKNFRNLNKSRETYTYSKSRPRFKLVAHPINHYGEKLRFCMDLLEVPYEEDDVIGISSGFLRGRSVPWLVDYESGSRIGNSDECLAFLLGVWAPQLPEPKRSDAMQLLSRTPETLQWEQRLSHLGHAIQGWAYHYILTPNYHRLSKACWGSYETAHVHPLERACMNLLHPVVVKLMRHVLKMDDKKILDWRKSTIDSIIDEADKALASNAYLTGNNLSYIDIGFASLMGAICMTSVSMCKNTKWANGRFKSFSGFADELAPPAEIAKLEMEFLKRPSGKHMLNIFQNRGKTLSQFKI